MIRNSTLLFVIVFFTFGFSAKAQKLLTNRQIYNYDLGDVFEYEVSLPQNPSDYVHEFVTILAKRFSSGNDSVFYTIKERSYYATGPTNIHDTTVTKTISYGQLDSVRIMQPYVSNKNDSFSWSMDSFHSRQENSFYNISPNPHYGPSEFHRDLSTWVEGLGETYSSDAQDGDGGTFTQLVYYKKKNEVYGTSFFAGLESPKKQSIILIMYPNPLKTGDELTISNASNGLNMIKIIDMCGKVVYSSCERGPAIRIGGIHLRPAIYSILINDETDILTQKFVVIQ